MDTLMDLLRDSAQEFGDATALAITPGIRQQRWSYQKLWEDSSRVASLLKDRGLEKGDHAVIWSSNRPEWVVAYFGCLLAGVVVIPLDVRSSPDFVSRIIQQTAPKIVFCSRQTSDDLPDSGAPTIALEGLEALLEGRPAQRNGPSIAAEDTAELMFTSGTTGDPKGVILTHRNLVSNIMACREVVPINSSNRLLSLLPLSHMLEQTAGLLVPLSRGASIIYPTSRQPRTLFNTMQRDGVTNFIMVPQALELLMSGIEREVRSKGKEKQWQFLLRIAPWMPMVVRRWLFRGVHQQMGGKLRYIMSGGAYLDPQLARKWETLGVPILQGYGATEASPVITTNTFQHNRLGSVGRVLPGQEIKIANDGEVLTRGPNVTPGYWQNPEATRAAFEDGWYRTGDLGYLDQDGFLYLKGRKKDLIVLPNGQNVYPEDLENLLNKQPGVKDSVVVGLPSESGVLRVHAALLMEEGHRASETVSLVNRQVSDHQRIRGHTVWPQEDFPRTHTLKIRKPLVMEFLQTRQRETDDDPDEDPDPTIIVEASS
jgi:long-chain acyl-CoA synthetase